MLTSLVGASAIQEAIGEGDHPTSDGGSFTARVQDGSDGRKEGWQEGGQPRDPKLVGPEHLKVSLRPPTAAPTGRKHLTSQGPFPKI